MPSPTKHVLTRYVPAEAQFIAAGLRSKTSRSTAPGQDVGLAGCLAEGL